MYFRILHVIVVTLIFCYIFIFCQVLPAYSWTATIIELNNDGTITALSDGTKDKIKLINVFLPDPDNLDYDGVQRYFRDNIINKSVTLKPFSVDGQIFICEIFLGSISINTDILEKGLAWYFPKYIHNDTWINSFNEAKTRRIGIWAQSSDKITIPNEMRAEVLKAEYLKKLRSPSKLPFYLHHNPYSGRYYNSYTSPTKDYDTAEARRADDYKAKYLKGGKVEDLIEYQKAFRNAIGY